ncbi:MAG: bifunctional 4-hydroxy-2-oxoglutarate aldolase/2-dehydro-3-deoxy-phosphogluconate aldolase [Saprospiraceae bacterium]
MNKITDLIINQGVLPLFFHKDTELSIKVMETLYSAGIKTLEYTNRGEAAFKNFEAMLKFKNTNFPDMKLGVGTIKNLEQAKSFVSISTDFVISPGLVDEVADYCKNENMLYIPGCMTPTEIIRAENLGLKMIKLFPGDKLEPSFLKSIKSIFPDLLFMPTGGVDTTPENIKSWFDAGVCAVGMGSKLISKNILEEKNYDLILTETHKVLDIIKNIRN